MSIASRFLLMMVATAAMAGVGAFFWWAGAGGWQGAVAAAVTFVNVALAIINGWGFMRAIERPTP